MSSNSLKIRHVTFSRTSRGWHCEITFTLTTSNQFTDEECEVDGICRGHSVFSILWAYVRAKRNMREYAKINGAKLGERHAKGWGT